MLSLHLLAAVLTAVPSLASSLDTLRATLPGSLHQCEDTEIFLFDSGASRPVDVLFLPSANVPAGQRSGTLTLDSASRLSPAFTLPGIDTPDASAHSFVLGLPAGAVVELFAFLPDGSGKALGLTRTIQTPLPSATDCLGSGNRMAAEPTTTAAPEPTTTAAAPTTVTPTPVVVPTTTATPTSTTSTETSSTMTTEAPSPTPTAEAPEAPAPSATATFAPARDAPAPVAPAPVAPTTPEAAPETPASAGNEAAAPGTSPATNATVSAFALVLTAVTTCFATVGSAAPDTPSSAALTGDLQSFRATVPGSLHQCDNSSIVFFDADSNGPISVLFVPSANVPNALRSSSSTLDAVRQLSPALQLNVADTPNAAPYPFSVNIPAGEVVELFGFFPDGSGKPLSLTRTIMTPLPSATNCLANKPSRRQLGAGVVTASWDVLAAPTPSSSHQRTLSPASTTTSSGTRSSGASASASPATHSLALFPSHDGNGFFTTAESLVNSGASQSGGSEAESASRSEGDSISSEHEAHSPSRADAREGRRRARAGAASRRESTSSSSYDHLSLDRSSRSLGGSWALTEEALSALPNNAAAHARTPTHLSTTPASVANTSDGAQSDADEDLLESTPHAASAGLGWSRWRKVRQGRVADTTGDSSDSRHSYPSPPPLSLSRRMKRRHRQEGRSGTSQKRSSASGSVGVAPTSLPPPPSASIVLPPPPVLIPTPERKDTAFFGKLVRKLVDVDTETMDLFHAAESLPTPTPSRSTSPTPSATPTPSLKEPPHGFQALASYARSELGFGFSDDVAMVVDDSGDETETEGNTTTRWIHYSPTSASRTSEPSRSHSLTSLPSYFLSPLSASSASAPVAVSPLKEQPPPLLRRTSSFSGKIMDDDSAWGGEFEGFEAAISYWRRILRRMRGIAA
ncbi:hypothetical protein RQP46_002592 [Phenoliferia psychrophenolica]